MNTSDTAARGAQNGRARLTDEQVAKLLQFHREGWTLSQLAARFGIGRTTAADIINGRSWANG